MMDDFGLYPREEAFDPLGVMLFKALQVIAFLFFLALLAVSPDAKDGKIDSKAEFLITMDWPDNHPDDFDLFVQDPAGNIAWYRRREAGFLTLDRDDRGGANDFIVVNGKKILSPVREEIVSVRGIVPGEYTVHRAAGRGEREGSEAQSDRPGNLRQQADARPYRRGKDRVALLARCRRQGGRRAAAAEVADGDVPKRPVEWRGSGSENRCQDAAP